VLITARDARLLEKDTSLNPGEPGDKVRGGVPGTKTRPTRTIAAGDRVGSLEVVASPGHTPGHVSFLDTRDGTLYAGDAFTNIGGLATTAKGSAVFPLAAVSTWDKPTGVQSARALRRLDPARLAFGHGKVLENPGPAMDEALARVESCGPPSRPDHRGRRRREPPASPTSRACGRRPRRSPIASACGRRRSTTTSTGATRSCGRSRCGGCVS
jgi:glyoxylase-like metal-dependent hydrolase (beta-lactamase superfamily II)